MSRPTPSKEDQKIQEWARELAEQLGEHERKPLRQIENIIKYCGLEFAQGLLEETRQIEAGGGMMVLEGDRRRTPGGVFFFLARQRMPEDAKLDVFYTWMAQAKRRAQAEMVYPPFEWETDRAEVMERLAQEPGEITKLKISLQGRPKALERRQNLLIATLVHEIPESITMPTGVPHPSGMVMPYMVVMSAKQWEQVETILEKDEHDLLVVEGFAAFDRELDGMAVFAQEVTTVREIKRKKGEAKRQEQIRQSKEGKDNRKPASGKPSARPPQRTDRPRPPQTDRGRPPRSDQPKSERGHLGTPPPVQEIEVDVPAGMPEEEVKKYVELHRAASTYRQRISDIESKPADQQFGLDMTQKLLRNIEKQIADMSKRYS